MDKPPFDFAVENYPLAPLTLYNVGGPARLALIPRTIEEAAAAYEWLCRQDCRRVVLGGGSNVLIADEGYDGVVFVTSKLNRIETLGSDCYRIDAGVILDDVVRNIMLVNNYAMVGGLTGIPGTVGGAIYMNAGTVNGSTCMLMVSVEVAGPGGLRLIPMHESLYSYRGQTFCPRGSLILRGTFQFNRSGEDQRAVYEHYVQRRKETQPQGRCCGSVFKNPPGEHAGRLIDKCGLKGVRKGGAVISTKHANFFMNEDGATCADLRWLIDFAKQTVKEKTNIELEEEVVYIR
jgi:UDP-N-acetylmuramate dehydrogenase